MFVDQNLNLLIVDIIDRFGIDALVETLEAYFRRPLSSAELNTLQDNVYSIIATNT